MNSVEIIKPDIFPEDIIISGVTKRNLELFPPRGFTLSHVGISEEEFKKNLLVFSNFIGVEVSNLRFNHQIHSDRIVIAEYTQKIEAADALITNKKNFVLFVKIADCGGVLIYEPNVQCIAAIHSGWKGSKENIVGKTIKMLQKQYQAQPSSMMVYLSPMASAKNYEVGVEFLQFFPSEVIYKIDNKLYYDNQKMILHQLNDAGVKPENIECSNLCTIDNIDLHSYRRDKENSGRMAAFICMK
jgi:YfiH family protein